MPKGQKKASAKGQSPPQQLEEGPRSGPHLLVLRTVQLIQEHLKDHEFLKQISFDVTICLFAREAAPGGCLKSGVPGNLSEPV